MQGEQYLRNWLDRVSPLHSLQRLLWCCGLITPPLITLGSHFIFVPTFNWNAVCNETRSISHIFPLAYVTAVMNSVLAWTACPCGAKQPRVPYPPAAYRRSRESQRDEAVNWARLIKVTLMALLSTEETHESRGNWHRRREVAGPGRGPGTRQGLDSVENTLAVSDRVPGAPGSQTDP